MINTSKLSRTLLVVFLFALCISPILSAAEYEEHYLNINVPSIGRLINYSTPLNVSSLIPYQEYSSVIVVEWAIPESALSNIKADEIFIFISITSTNETEFVYFNKEGGISKSATSVLRCKIIEGKCGEGSELRKEVPFSIKLNKWGIDFNDVIIIRASLIPSSEVPKLINESAVLNETITEMKQEIEGLNVSDTEKNSFTTSLKNVESKLEVYDVNQANADIAELNKTLDKLEHKSTLLTSISLIEKEIKNKVNLTKEESDIVMDIAPLLADARNATNSMDFGRAELSFNLAKNKYGLLNDMIEDRMKTIPFLRKDLIYIASFSFAVIILILSAITKLRRNEKILGILFSIFLIAMGILNLENILGIGVYLVIIIIEILMLLLFTYFFIKRKRRLERAD